MSSWFNAGEGEGVVDGASTKSAIIKRKSKQGCLHGRKKTQGGGKARGYIEGTR